MHVFVRRKRRRLFGCRKLKYLPWLCTASALLVVAGCDSAKPLSVAPELFGTWRTQDPRYAGLFFKIDNRTFSFSTAEGNIESYAIVRYEQSEAQQGRGGYTHVLHGTRDGRKLQVNMLYESLGGGKLTFKNQNRTIWSREDAQKQ